MLDWSISLVPCCSLLLSLSLFYPRPVVVFPHIFGCIKASILKYSGNYHKCVQLVKEESREETGEKYRAKIWFLVENIYVYIIDEYMSRDLDVPGLDFMSQGLTGYWKVIHGKMLRMMFMDNAFHGEVINKRKKKIKKSYRFLWTSNLFVILFLYVIYLMIELIKF